MWQISSETGQKRAQSTKTPISISSFRSTNRSKSNSVKKQKNVADIYRDIKQKIYQMQSAFKQQRTMMERQMLKTYIKVLEKIGEQVIESKQRYLNLDKQTLKTDKRLEIVTQMNKQRSQCGILFNKIKNVKEQIKKYQDQNNFLEKQVQALQDVEKRKKTLEKQQKSKYKQSRKKILSLGKQLPQASIQNQMVNLNSKKSAQLSKTFELKNRVKSFALNDQDLQNNIQNLDLKFQKRPHTQQKQEINLGVKRRKNKYFNLPLQQNISIEKIQ